MVCLSICISQMAAHTGLLDNCDVGATTLYVLIQRSFDRTLTLQCSVTWVGMYAVDNAVTNAYVITLVL